MLLTKMHGPKNIKTPFVSFTNGERKWRQTHHTLHGHEAVSTAQAESSTSPRLPAEEQRMKWEWGWNEARRCSERKGGEWASCTGFPFGSLGRVKAGFPPWAGAGGCLCIGHFWYWQHVGQSSLQKFSLKHVEKNPSNKTIRYHHSDNVFCVQVIVEASG